MALYKGFDITLVKMPKYLAINRYQNKNRKNLGLTLIPKKAYNSAYTCV